MISDTKTFLCWVRASTTTQARAIVAVLTKKERALNIQVAHDPVCNEGRPDVARATYRTGAASSACSTICVHVLRETLTHFAPLLSVFKYVRCLTSNSRLIIVAPVRVGESYKIACV